MADETQTDASPADKSADQRTNDVDSKALEAANKALEAQVTQQGQKLAQLEGELQMMSPYVNFPTSQEPAAEAPAYDPNDPEEFFDYKLKTEIGKVQSQAQASLKAVEFLSDNPDLKPHRERLAFVFGKKTDSRKSVDARLADAAKAVRAEIKTIEDRAVARQTEADKAKAKAKAQAEGVITGHQGASEEGDEEDKVMSMAEYSTMRQEQANRASGGY